MHPFRRAHAWLREHPFGADAILAALFVALSVVTVAFFEVGAENRPNDAVAWVAALVSSTSLAWRRRRPVLVAAITFAATAVSVVGDYLGNASDLAPLVALYTVAAWSTRRRALWTAAAAAAAALLVVLGTDIARGESEGLGVDELVGNVIIFGTAWILGDNMRNRRGRLRALEKRAVLAEQGREEAARQAVADERTRIARELHDVVAHGMSVMVVQAGAARRTLDRDPDRAREALASIEEVGRSSLDEMRRLLGVLRHEEDRAVALDPQPTVGQLEALVASTREAGLAVDLVVEGEPRPLPVGVGLSAYRIVQEALTNTPQARRPCRRPREGPLRRRRPPAGGRRRRAGGGRKRRRPRPARHAGAGGAVRGRPADRQPPRWRVRGEGAAAVLTLGSAKP